MLKFLFLVLWSLPTFSGPLPLNKFSKPIACLNELSKIGAFGDGVSLKFSDEPHPEKSMVIGLHVPERKSPSAGDIVSKKVMGNGQIIEQTKSKHILTRPSGETTSMAYLVSMIKGDETGFLSRVEMGLSKLQKNDPLQVGWLKTYCRDLPQDGDWITIRELLVKAKVINEVPTSQKSVESGKGHQ